MIVTSASKRIRAGTEKHRKKSKKISISFYSTPLSHELLNVLCLLKIMLIRQENECKQKFKQKILISSERKATKMKPLYEELALKWIIY